MCEYLTALKRLLDFTTCLSGLNRLKYVLIQTDCFIIILYNVLHIMARLHVDRIIRTQLYR